jgi:hypothetical protein
VHVVLDAPVDAGGQSDLTAARDGSDCQVQVKAHSGSGKAVAGRPLIVRLGADCTVQDDGQILPPTLADVGGADAPGSSGSPLVVNSAAGGAGNGMGAPSQQAPGAMAAGCAIVPGKTGRRQRAVGLVGLGLFGLARLARRRKHARRD